MSDINFAFISAHLEATLGHVQGHQGADPNLEAVADRLAEASQDQSPHHIVVPDLLTKTAKLMTNMMIMTTEC